MKHRFSHKPRKRFGQNFLQDQGIIQKILECIAPKSTDNIIEIGPGLGALTQPLLDLIDHLDVIELDRVLANQLDSTWGQTNKLTVHSTDALQFDFNTLQNKNTQKKLRIIGNLPYNITTPLIFHLFNFCHSIEDMHFMLQKEVVERIVAQPNHKQYGRLSIMAQYFCQAQYLFTVPSHAFYPKPKVESAFVRLTPYLKPHHLANNIKCFQDVTRTAFNQRRKTLSNALKTYLNHEYFIKLSIDSTQRPETLSLADFVKISNFIHQRNEV